jgi:hypothetical protein
MKRVRLNRREFTVADCVVLENKGGNVVVSVPKEMSFNGKLCGCIVHTNVPRTVDRSVRMVEAAAKWCTWFASGQDKEQYAKLCGQPVVDPPEGTS